MPSPADNVLVLDALAVQGLGGTCALEWLMAYLALISTTSLVDVPHE